jgi:hypothetical protein
MVGNPEGRLELDELPVTLASLTGRGTAKGRRLPTILAGIRSYPRRARRAPSGCFGSEGGCPPTIDDVHP